MKKSAGYLYEKSDNDPLNTGQHPGFAMQSTMEEFLSAVEQLREMRFEETRRKSFTNNQIQHLVVSCHPTDAVKFEHARDEILEKLFNELNIVPENHLMNAFVHYDEPHPHVHLLFSKIGEDLTVLYDRKIGERLGEFAEKISKDYGFKYKNETPKISFSRKDLYKPTERTALLKLIDFAMKEANSFENYIEIMKQHQVKFVQQGKTKGYLIPNPNVVSEELFPEKLHEATKYKEDRELYKRFLLSHGIRVKFDETGKESYSLKKHTFVPLKNLPKQAKGKLLRKGIEESTFDLDYLKLRNEIINGIDKCKTLGEIQDLLPGSKLRYKIIDNRVEKISLEYGDHFIRLHEGFTMDVRIEATQDFSSPLTIPVIFSPRSYDDFEEERQKILAKKYGKQRRQIGFKHQLR